MQKGSVTMSQKYISHFVAYYAIFDKNRTGVISPPMAGIRVKIVSLYDIIIMHSEHIYNTLAFYDINATF